MTRAVLALALVLLAGGVAWTALRAPEPDPPVPVEAHGFRLAQTAQDAPPLLWAIGDGADGSARSRRVAELVAGENPRAVLYLGDVYERGTREEFQRNYHGAYGGLAPRTAPTPGNHEWDRRHEGYLPYWRGITGVTPPLWYAFRIAGWEILSLNSQARRGPRSPQVRWLRAQVRAPGACRLAFWHDPLMSAGEQGDSPGVRHLWRALRGRARIVLGGHDHSMQRFERRDGMTLLVSGAGGRERHEVDEDDPRLAFADDDAHGALRIALRPGRAELAFVRVGGEVLHRYTARCERR